MFSMFFHSKDRAIYLVCCLVGFVVSLAARPEFWAPYAGVLVTYNLFLAWLVLSGEEKTARSHGILATVAGHIAFLILLVAARFGLMTSLIHAVQSESNGLLDPTSILGMRIVRTLQVLITYGLVYCEMTMLFSGVRDKQAASPDETAVMMAPPLVPLQPGAPLEAATGADHYEWLQSRSNQKTMHYDPRKSPADDFEQWLRARGKTQYPLSQSESNAVAN